MSNIDELIKPYQIALDELNEEIGSALCIPEDAKSNVYEAYKNYSISEFKEMIRREYQNSSSDESIYKEGVQFTEDIIIK